MAENKNEVIRFRVTEYDRERIQVLADMRTNGNVSKLIMDLIDHAGDEDSMPGYTAEIIAVLRKHGKNVRNVKIGELTL